MMDVITCARANLRPKPNNMQNRGGGKKRAVSEKELLAIHEKRLRRILDVAVMQEEQVVILGVVGCGAFQNSPNVVARAAKLCWKSTHRHSGLLNLQCTALRWMI